MGLRFDLIFNEAKPNKATVDEDNSIEQEPILVNLSQYFRNGKPYTFPSHFDGIRNESSLVMQLKMASIQAGFLLTKRSSLTKTQMKTKYHSKSTSLWVVNTLGCMRNVRTVRTNVT